MPDWKAIVNQRLSGLHLQPAAERDLAEEFAQHLEDRYRDLVSGGSSEEEAYRATVSELNDIYPLREASRRTPHEKKDGGAILGNPSRGNRLEEIWRDLCYAARSMRKGPLFVLFVVLTLALGIGANTTVFTVINTLILNPLPIPDSAGLVAVSGVKTQNNTRSQTPLAISYPDFESYQAGNALFRSLAAYTTPHGVTWQTGSSSQGLFTELVTGNYFSALELSPARGRFFLPEEDGTPGAHAVAVLNYGTWQNRFGGSTEILGKTLRLNNIVFTIVGVAPPQFIGVNGLFGPDLWVPFAMAEQLLPVEMKGVLTDRSKAVLQGVGRLKAGETRAKAQANLATIATNLAREYPSTNEGRTVLIRPVREVLFANNNSSSGQILFASVGLLLVVGIVLLIACSNVANLLLARSASRQREMAVRLAVGANRGRLVRQLLTESIFLGLISGTVGLMVAYAALHLLFGVLPSSANFVAPKLDAPVFAFALLISLGTGLLFGIAPALKSSRASVTEALKEEARTTGRSRKKVTMANALLIGQVAFSFLLLMTAMLFLRSIGRAYNIDPGFQTAHLAVFMTNPGQAGYGKPQIKAFYKDAVERVARMPGIASVSWASNLPLWERPATGLQVEGRQQLSRAEQISTIVNTIAPRYFETSGIVVEHGREFTNLDQEKTTPVAIVNEKLAREFWPRGDALGKRIQVPGEKQLRQIVGIARTANYSNWAEAPQFCVYIPLEQNYSDAMNLYVRSQGKPEQILTQVQHELRAVAPRLMVSVLTGRKVIEGGLFFARTGVSLLSVFGLLALSLASIGLYGILAYSVNQRKREIGLRMALGAGRSSVLAMVLKEGMSMVLAGVLIGFAATLIVGRFLSRMLYGVSTSDPLSIAEAVAVLSVIALLACYLPARAASRVDPLVALREG
jgi:predicted permease